MEFLLLLLQETEAGGRCWVVSTRGDAHGFSRGPGKSTELPGSPTAPLPHQHLLDPSGNQGYGCTSLHLPGHARVPSTSFVYSKMPSKVSSANVSHTSKDAHLHLT